MKNLLLTPLLGLAAMAPASAQQVLLDQQPTRTFGLYSETSPISSSNADDFSVGAAGATIGEITWWGYYDPSGQPGPDAFGIRIHDNTTSGPPFNYNQPGNLLHEWTAQQPTRTQTGLQGQSFGGQLDEYRFDFVLPSAVTLAPGHYWVEIWNDTPSTPDSFVWGCGTLDPINGVPGFQFSFTAPGTTWQNSLVPASGMSLQVREPSGPTGPALAWSGSCPGAGTVSVNGATPGGAVYLGYSRTLGPWAVPTGPCAGTVLDLVTPTLVTVLTADAQGDAAAPANVPAAACGQVHVQAFDLGGCLGTNVLSL